MARLIIRRILRTRRVQCCHHQSSVRSLSTPTPLEVMRAMISGDRETAAHIALLGQRLLSAEPGRVTGVFEREGVPAAGAAGTPIPGQFISALVESAVSCALDSVLMEGEVTAIIDMHMSFVRPAFGTQLLVNSELVHHGKTISLVEGHVRDLDKRVIARFGGTCMTLRAGQAAGRIPETYGQSSRPD